MMIVWAIAITILCMPLVPTAAAIQCVFLIFVSTESIQRFIYILGWIVNFLFWNRNRFNNNFIVKCFEFRCFDHVDNNLWQWNSFRWNLFSALTLSGILWCFWLQFNQADDFQGVTLFSISIENDFIWSKSSTGSDLVTAWGKKGGDSRGSHCWEIFH